MTVAGKPAITLGAIGLLCVAACAPGAPVSAARRPASRWWHPADAGRNNGPEFYWELDHPLTRAELTRAASQSVYDIDGINNPASTVAALHRRGNRVICYIEVGAAGNYYSAAGEGIAVSYYARLAAAGDLGRKMAGYPERYLDINSASTVSIVESMIRQQCAAKGFDAVEPDIDDSYTDRTGYHISEAQNERYDGRLGAYAHRLGLAWGQKNGDNDPAFSAALAPRTDFLLTEECRYYRTCGIVAPPYLAAGKLVLDAEYTDDWGGGAAADLGRFCPADRSGRLDGTLFTSSLAGQRHPCRLAG